MSSMSHDPSKHDSFNHSNMLIWCSKKHLLLSMLSTVVLLNVFVETMIMLFWSMEYLFIWNNSFSTL